MNIAYVTAIISVLVLLIFVAMSFIRSGDMKFQMVYVVVAAFCIGIITSIILVNYDNRSAVVWPALFLIHVISKAREIMRSI